MCLGVAYSWGVFLVPIDQDMGWGRAKISFAVSVLLLVFSLFMAIGGFCERKIGPRYTASLGGLLVGLGWVSASFAHSPLGLYICYGVLAGVGTGLSYMPSISTGIKWFPERKGLVTGIIIFGFGFGTAFLSPLITHIIRIYGWRATMMSCGFVFWVVIITAAQFLKNPVFPANPSDNAGANKERSFSPKEMLGTGSFKIMFATYFVAMVAGMMTISHLVAFAQDRNFTAMQGALALTILSVFNGAGRVFFGYISDLWSGRRVLILLFTLIGFAMFSLYHANSMLLIYLISGVIGLCFGGFLAVYPPLTADFFGHRDFAVNYGLVFIGYGSGCFLGPLIGGIVHDLTKNYSMAFYSAGCLAMIGGMAIFFFLKTPAAKLYSKQEER